MVTARDLERILAVARFRSFRQAADHLAITQPTLSQAIAAVEEDYGVLLFDRRHTPIQLTAYGEAVIRAAEDILPRIDSIGREIELMRDMSSGRLVIGTEAWICEPVLAPAVGRLLGEYPRLLFSIRCANRASLEDQLLDHRIDLLIASPSSTPQPELELVDVAVPPAFAVCRAGHPLAQGPTIRMADAFRYPIIAPRPPEWFYEWLQGELGLDYRPDWRTHPYLETDDYAAIRRLLFESEGVSYGIGAAFDREIESGALVARPIRNLDLAVPLQIATLKVRPRLPATEILINRIREAASRLWNAGPVRRSSRSRKRKSPSRSGRRRRSGGA